MGELQKCRNKSYKMQNIEKVQARWRWNESKEKTYINRIEMLDIYGKRLQINFQNQN